MGVLKEILEYLRQSRAPREIYEKLERVLGLGGLAAIPSLEQE